MLSNSLVLMRTPCINATRWATVLKFGYSLFGKTFRIFFVIMVRVIDLATAHNSVEIIARG